MECIVFIVLTRAGHGVLSFYCQDKTYMQLTQHRKGVNTIRLDNLLSEHFKGKMRSWMRQLNTGKTI